MSEAPLERLLDLGEEHARRVLLENREPQLAPFYHLIAPDGRRDIIVPCSWSSQAEKQRNVARVKAVARALGAVAALFCHEAWSLKTRGTQLPDIRPSESPDRKEIVQLVATDGEHTVARSLQIVRDRPDGAIIALIADTPALWGGFSGLMVDDIIQRSRARP